MLNVFLLGAYGQNNLGDEALLEVFLQQLQACKIVVNSAQPAQTTQRYGVTTVATYGQWPHIPQLLALLRADVVVFGGGSLLKELEQGHIARIMYFLRIFAVLFYCKLFGRVTAMLGVGIGPLRQPFYCWLSHHAAQLTNLICVRDHESRELLISVGVTRPVYVTADPVFLANPEQLPASRAPVAQSTQVIVVPRYSLTEPQIDALAQACDQVIEEYNATITMLVFQTGYHPQYDDRRVAEAIQSRMQYAHAVSITIPRLPQEAIDAIAHADLVISTRLHGLIFACMQSIPMIAIDYEVKVRNFMHEIGQDWAYVSLPELISGELSPMIRNVWSRRLATTAHLDTITTQLRERAAQNSILLHKTLQGIFPEAYAEVSQAKPARRSRGGWRTLLLTGLTLLTAVMMWRVAHAEAPSVSHPAQQQIDLIMPSLLDSEAEQASGAYIPNLGAVLTLQVLRGPNAIAEKPAALGVRDWMIHLLLTFGTQLSAVPPNEQIAISTEYYNYEDTVYHQFVITVRAADIADTSKYLFWLDGQPFDQATQTSTTP